MSLLRSVWPVRWFPPFRRGDWADEEVIKREHFGTYDQAKIPGYRKFITLDFDRRKKIEIEFLGGFIDVRETPIPIYLRSHYERKRVFGEMFLEWLVSPFRRIEDASRT